MLPCRPSAARRLRAARRERLRHALAQLSPRDRAIFQLVIAERASLTDAAAALAVSVAALEDDVVDLLLRLERGLRGDTAQATVPD